MFTRKSIIFLSILSITVLSACNMPGAQSTQAPELALTITAQALLLETTSTFTPIPETATPEFTATVTLTPTPSVPTATVSQNTNCRTGPGTEYDLIGALLIGQSAEVVGKNTPSGYWIIKTPGGVGTCWLWGQYATVSGNVAALPEFVIPPTPTPPPSATPAPPAPVKDLTANKICIPLILPNYQYTGTLTWVDKSDNENGFNIYFNGGLFGSVGANVTNYPIPPLVFPMGVPMKLGVEAFNDAGKSITKEVTFICP